MKLVLVDINSRLVQAWRDKFASYPEVEIHCENILAVAENMIVSPANSYGFMDGGIDSAYVQFFGMSVQNAVQAAIARRPENLLPVGASTLVSTGHARIPYLIAAPTMEGPEHVEARNAGRTMNAIFRIAMQHRDVVKSIYCPGLTTGIGGVPPDDAAIEMANSYREWRSRLAT